MTTTLLAPWAMPIFCVAVLLVIAGIVVQFDVRPSNDTPGRMAIAVFTPVALLAGAVMWGVK